MTKTRILIEVSGGIVNDIFSDNPDITVILADYDNLKENETEPHIYIVDPIGEREQNIIERAIN